MDSSASMFIRSTADLERLAVFGSTPESRTLDFKSDFGKRHSPDDKTRRDGRRETARDIAQFANTVGGCLLVGVGETKDSATGIKVAKGAEPLHDADNLRVWVEESVKDFLVPSTISFTFDAISYGGGTIVAVNVPASQHLVTVYDRQTHTSQFVRRTNHGKAYMNPDEMERHLMNGSRAAYLKVQEVVGKSCTPGTKVVDGLWIQHGGERPERTRSTKPIELDVSSEGVLALGVYTNNDRLGVQVPYGLVEEVWTDADGAVNLLLKKRLVLRGNVVELFPIPIT